MPDEKDRKASFVFPSPGLSFRSEKDRGCARPSATTSSRETLRHPEEEAVAAPENSMMRLWGIPNLRAASRTIGSDAGCAMMSVARVLVSWKTGS